MDDEGWTLTWFLSTFSFYLKNTKWFCSCCRTTFFQKRFFFCSPSWKSFLQGRMRANQQARIKVSNTQFSRFWRLKWGKLFIGTQGRRTKSDAKNPGDFSFWHIWCLYCIFWYKNRTPSLTKNRSKFKIKRLEKSWVDRNQRWEKISHFHFLVYQMFLELYLEQAANWIMGSAKKNNLSGNSLPFLCDLSR